MRFIKLIFSDYKNVVFICITIPFVIFTLAERVISEELKSIILGIYSSIALIVIQSLYNIISKYRKYIKLEGNYYPYSYDSLEENFEIDGKVFKRIVEGAHSYKLKSKRNGLAKLKYEGGNEFTIRLEEIEKENIHYIWEGKMTFNTIDLADVVWSYISPPDLVNSSGFKKAVIINSIPPKVFLFSPDGQGYGREVLIKIT